MIDLMHLRIMLSHVMPESKLTDCYQYSFISYDNLVCNSCPSKQSCVASCQIEHFYVKTTLKLSNKWTWPRLEAPFPNALPLLIKQIIFYKHKHYKIHIHHQVVSTYSKKILGKFRSQCPCSLRQLVGILSTCLQAILSSVQEPSTLSVGRRAVCTHFQTTKYNKTV